METVDELNAKIKELTAKREQIIKEERVDALKKCRELVAKYELKTSEVFSKRGPNKTKTPPAPAMYRDPATGKTWNGRGRKPKEMIGKDMDTLKI